MGSRHETEAVELQVRCEVLSRDSGIAVRCNACEGWFQARMKENKEVNARCPLSVNFVSPPRDELRLGSLVRCGQGQGSV